MFTRKYTIAKKILFSCLFISLIPLIIAGATAYIFFENGIREEVFKNLSIVADNRKHIFEDFLADKKLDVRALSLNPFIIEAMEAYSTAYHKGVFSNETVLRLDREHKAFLTYYKNAFKYHDLHLLCKHGNVVFSVKRDEDFGTNLYTGPFRNTQMAEVFRKVMETADTAVSDFRYYPPSAKPSLFIGAPVMKNGNILGVLVFHLENTEIYNEVKNYIGLGETGETVIASRQGDEAVITAPLRHDPEAAFKKRITLGSDESLPVQRAVQGWSGYGVFTDYRGKEILAVWRYLPVLKWGVVVKMDKNEAYKQIIPLRNWTFVISVITVISVILIALRISRSISGPIKQLHKGSELVGSGNLDYRVGTGGGDEIGELSRSFDEMTMKLKKYRTDLEEEIQERKAAEEKLRKAKQEIEGWNRELEARVEDKTRELVRSQEQLIRSEKLSTMGQIAGGIAHELSSPLAGLLPLLEAYREKAEKGSREQKELTLMLRSANHMAKIVKTFGMFSRKPEGEHKILDLNEVIEDTLSFSAVKLRHKGIRILKAYTEKPPLVRGDRTELQQVVLNMITNAADAMGKGGNLVIRTSYHEKKNMLMMQFQDNGSGIEKENLDRIFDPFFTTKKAGEGTGLGLSVTYGIVEKHSGEITVESEPGKGTTFTISLPAAK